VALLRFVLSTSKSTRVPADSGGETINLELGDVPLLTRHRFIHPPRGT
jgi:hypothetical protein